jgi:hypothetical protein
MILKQYSYSHKNAAQAGRKEGREDEEESKIKKTD